MKKELRSLLLFLMSVFFVLALLLSALFIGQGIKVFADTTEIYQYSNFDTESIDNSSVIITLTESETKKFKTYSANDFKEVGCIGVEELTTYTSNYAQAKIRGSYSCESMLVDVDNFKKILKLNLCDSNTDNIIKAIDVLNKRNDVFVAGPNFIYSIDAIPNDTYWGNDGMWGLNGTYGIQAESAWDISTGSNSITVGVLDTGIQANHPDLVNRISTAGLHADFTANPYIMVSNTNLVDPHGHGTHVAGIIGAQGNNSIGTTGVCWDIRLVSLRVFDETGHGSSASLALAINYAASKNIPILNYSGGWSGSNDTNLQEELEAYNGLFVCSAGNGGMDEIGDDNDKLAHYPSDFSNNYACSDRVISVGSIDEDGNRSVSSNYGKTTVDIFAPGNNIASTWPGDSFVMASGTSMAAPFVTGVAALILSMNEILTATEIKQIICDNVDKDSRLSGLCVTGGRLNAYKAVSSVGMKITFNNDGYINRYHYVNVKYGEAMPEVSFFAPKKEGYAFEGYFDSNGNKYYEMRVADDRQTADINMLEHAFIEKVFPVSGKKWYKNTNTTLEARWKLLECDYIYQNICNGKPFSSSEVDLKTGKNIIKPDVIKDYKFSYFTRDLVRVDTNEFDLILYRNYDNIIRPNCLIRAVYEEDKTCLAEGTMITLADGSQKPVELLTGNEQLLVWNLNTGSFDCAPILFIDNDAAQLYEVINLYFSDGTCVEVISEHAFWDINLNKYVTLSYDAEQYVGHWFNKQTTNTGGALGWTSVQLINVEIQEEYTSAWSPVTYGHLCYYVNGMLSMPGGIEGLYNIFEVDAELMKYDTAAYEADIATYGLFTYEEFCELYDIPELMFDACGGQYLKVAIGKGLLDYSTLSGLVERYGAFFEA